MKRVIADTKPDPTISGQANDALDGTRINCMTKDCHIYYYWDGSWRDGIGWEFLTPSSAYVGIDGVNTGYDTPLNGPDSFDAPSPANGITARSRRKVDFPLLTGATPMAAFPHIIDTGRGNGSENENQAGVSRYQTETVRINLEATRAAMGRLRFIRSGANP